MITAHSNLYGAKACYKFDFLQLAEANCNV